jgi:formate hydrogenlyase subunit 4
VTALFSVVAQLLHAALVLAAAPVVTGVLALFEARLQGRSGPHPLQPWRDLFRMFRKQSLLAENVSWLFRWAPVIVFASIGVAAALVPSFALGMASAPAADLLVIAGLLMLARCVLALAALDTGSAFGGIGASRIAFVFVFAEPALLVLFFVVSLLAGSTNVDAIAATLREGGMSRVSLALALPAVLAVVLADGGRVLTGGGATAELRMVDAAGTLEYSGRRLALLEAAAALRLLVWFSLVAVVFVPFGVAPAGASPGQWVVGLAAWAAKILVLVAVLAVFEMVVARMRLFRAPEFLGVALLLALLAAVLWFVGQGTA